MENNKDYMETPPTPEQTNTFPVHYRGFLLWWVPQYEDWVISDNGGWLPGAFGSPDEAVDATLKYLESLDTTPRTD